MASFQHLYGIPKTNVQKTCLVLPFLPAGVLRAFGIERLKDGLIFSSASSKDITLIKAHMGAGFVGDAVLGLNDTACENILFLGTAGLIQKNSPITIGDLVVAEQALAFGSFTQALSNTLTDPIATHADETLSATLPQDIARVTVASFASILLEENFLDTFEQYQCDVIEMECAAFFAAAKSIQRAASALLVISDIPGHKRLTEPMSDEDKKKTLEGFSQGCEIIKNLH